MAPPPSPNSDENKMWLRQKGNIKEFNSLFDEAMSKLQLLECYLVMTYVVGLKKEIADSVRLFHPRTMHEAKILARMQEIMIEMQIEKARKELDDQEKGLVAQESNGSCSFNTQECIVNQEASVKTEPEKQETSVAQETKDDDHQVECVTVQDPRELPSMIVGGVAEKTQEASSIKVVHGARTETTGSFDCTFRRPSVTERTREVTTSPSGFGLGFSLNKLVPMCHKPGTWESTKMANNSSGSQSLRSKGSDSSISSMSMTSFAKLMVAVFLLPLSLISLPASLFQFMDCSILEDYARVSRSVELVMVCTCMQKNRFGKSTLQLACIFLFGQKYSEDDACYGFVFQERAWIQWLTIKALFCHLLPTLCISLTWFKGCLIKMLVGSSLIQGVRQIISG